MTDDKDVTGALADPGHLFDQTNGVADGLGGDSDGTAAGDTASRAERADRDEDTGVATSYGDSRGDDAFPIGQQDAYAEDHGVSDQERDPNP